MPEFTLGAPYGRRRITPEQYLDSQTERVRTFIETTLSNKFNMQVKVDDETCRIIAYSASVNRGDSIVCLNGRKVNQKDLLLRLNLDLQPEATTY